MIQSPEAPWAVELAHFRKVFRPHWSRRPVVAVHEISLRLAPGRVLGLLGPNGSGKSTTLKALAGLVTPTAGECRIHGHVAGSVAAQRLCGYLPDSPRFGSSQTAREFLHTCAALGGISADAVEASLAWSGLGAAANMRLGGFSKGMLQRLGLAQAVIGDPAVVLLDEPESGLDPAGRQMLVKLIRQLRSRETTVVFSSHLLSHAVELCDEIAILGHGRVLVAGAPEALLGAQAATDVVGARLEQCYLEHVCPHD